MISICRVWSLPVDVKRVPAMRGTYMEYIARLADTLDDDGVRQRRVMVLEIRKLRRQKGRQRCIVSNFCAVEDGCGALARLSGYFLENLMSLRGEEGRGVFGLNRTVANTSREIHFRQGVFSPDRDCSGKI